jgi:glycosyltransferase involved in cell wall biosynthesis
MYHGNLAAMAVASRARLPVVWGVRQSLGSGPRDKWLTRRIIGAGALISKRAALIVYNSNPAREQHERRGYASDRGVVVLNGFDTNEFRPDSTRAKVARSELLIGTDVLAIGHVARFHPVKDHATFLHAAARVRDKFPTAVFVLVGEGVDASNRELTKLIDGLGLAGSVRLLGRRDDVPRLLAAFDVVALTSTGESFPNAVGEAMSCGVPCVSTAVGEVAELIGDTGEVVPPSDSEAVAMAVGRLLSLAPAARRALGARARQRIIDRFSIGEVARRYADLLHSVAEQNH